MSASPTPVLAPVVAIVLAAGKGARLGGPKALLLVRPPVSPHEMPLIEAQCRDRLAAESARALAVVRPDVAALVAGRLRAAGAEPVASRAPDALGPAGSLAAAAAHLASAFTPDLVALVTPVDVRASAATASALVAALLAPSEGPPPLAAVPRHAGRRGHPVALRAEALARYLDPDPPPLRDHLRALADRVLPVDVDDPLILEDLDFPHQTEALLRLTGGPTPVFWSP